MDLRTLGSVASIVVLLVTPPTAHAIFWGGTTSIPSSRPGARAAALGGSYTAVVADASAIAWNPGALVMGSNEISVVGSFSEALPLTDGANNWFVASRIPLGRRVGIAGSLAYFGYSYEIEAYDEGGSFAGFDDYNDSEVLLSAAAAVAIGDHVGVGVGIGYLSHAADEEPSEWNPETSGDGVLANLGLLVSHPLDAAGWPGEMRLGLSALNLGADISGVSPPSPYWGSREREVKGELHFGAAWVLGGNDSVGITLTAEHTEVLSEDKNPTLSGGVELSVPLTRRGAVAARAGYVHAFDGWIQDFTFGGGLEFEVGSARVGVGFASVPPFPHFPKSRAVRLDASLSFALGS